MKKTANGAIHLFGLFGKLEGRQFLLKTWAFIALRTKSPATVLAPIQKSLQGGPTASVEIFILHCFRDVS
jgi:hypothetical protein